MWITVNTYTWDIVSSKGGPIALLQMIRTEKKSFRISVNIAEDFLIWEDIIFSNTIVSVCVLGTYVFDRAFMKIVYKTISNLHQT